MFSCRNKKFIHNFWLKKSILSEGMEQKQFFFVFRLQLRKLDFRSCAVPDGEKILQVLKRTSNAGE